MTNREIKIEDCPSASIRNLAKAANAETLRLIRREGEYQLWRDEEDRDYINDGADSYTEHSEEFKEIFDRVFAL